MTVEIAALATAVLLCWVAIVHFALAAGMRRGDLVWSGRQPRLLAPELRVRSALVAVMLLVSGAVLAEATGLIDTGLIDDAYMQSATFAVMAFLGVYFIYAVFWGSRWERMLFAPITFAGALLAGWLTFT
ncbi:MAG TPA: hypothetical protein VFT85_04085 [Acidimicrobiia bacterium]|nr:hypothetical protein [Acidimicrobiia bacterium]